MADRDFKSHRKGRLPLAVRLSFILMLAAVLPLLLTVGITEYAISRPDLINQANQTMITDAATRTQEIDAYLTERILDTETLAQVPTVIGYLADPTVDGAASHAGYALAAGKIRDNNYSSWWLFNAKETPMLVYPTTAQPYQYGPYLVPPEEWQALTSDKTGLAVLSPVYLNPTTQKAFIDIYAPIYLDGTPKSPLLGFMRASLNLDYIWKITANDKGLSNSGSSFILDQNGVRIADTNDKSPDLFTAVTQVAPKIQQQMLTEGWYGQNSQVQVKADQNLARAMTNTQANNFTLTINAGGQNQEYQAGSAKTAIGSWTYIVISPSNTVTHVADQQLLITIIVGVLVAAVAAGIGLWVSNRISRPIMRSVEQLQENSEALNSLAKKQQSASTEQMWVVDSIQVGLQSVQYYTDATRIAAHKLDEVGLELEKGWRTQNIESVKTGLQQVIKAAEYIGKATNYQGESSQKLGTAIKVTAQVNEQLADGAISATEAASQLEQVVNDLRTVVGR